MEIIPEAVIPLPLYVFIHSELVPLHTHTSSSSVYLKLDLCSQSYFLVWIPMIDEQYSMLSSAMQNVNCIV